VKRLNHNEIKEAFKMPRPVQVRWDLLPEVFELQAHGVVTLDMSPNFIGIAKTYKEARKHHRYEDLKVYRINAATKTKKQEYMNPNYV
jgi:hypothetical protein